MSIDTSDFLEQSFAVLNGIRKEAEEIAADNEAADKEDQAAMVGARYVVLTNNERRAKNHARVTTLDTALGRTTESTTSEPPASADEDDESEPAPAPAAEEEEDDSPPAPASVEQEDITRPADTAKAEASSDDSKVTKTEGNAVVNAWNGFVWTPMRKWIIWFSVALGGLWGWNMGYVHFGPQIQHMHEKAGEPFLAWVYHLVVAALWVGITAFVVGSFVFWVLWFLQNLDDS